MYRCYPLFDEHNNNRASSTLSQESQECWVDLFYQFSFSTVVGTRINYADWVFMCAPGVFFMWNRWMKCVFKLISTLTGYYIPKKTNPTKWPQCENTICAFRNGHLQTISVLIVTVATKVVILWLHFCSQNYLFFSFCTKKVIKLINWFSCLYSCLHVSIPNGVAAKWLPKKLHVATISWIIKWLVSV